MVFRYRSRSDCSSCSALARALARDMGLSPVASLEVGMGVSALMLIAFHHFGPGSIRMRGKREPRTLVEVELRAWVESASAESPILERRRPGAPMGSIESDLIAVRRLMSDFSVLAARGRGVVFRASKWAV